ncbi:MAG: endonuclease III [Candidatus Eisenbacteria bacterium]|nr:endonuclease III [Candidatus Eisenbacteria bacterium]
MSGSRRTTTRIPGDRPEVPRELVLRARRIDRSLQKAYPDAHCALDFQSPLDLYVATVLSAQCTDERVNMVTPHLFARCRRPEDYLALGPAGLEEIIRSTGFFRAKARNILAGCQAILDRHDGELPRTMEELVKIPGCGRKTANVILGNAFGTPGITVDTHMGRIARRLEFTAEKDPVKVEAELQQLIPEQDWTMFSHRVISHGRAICDARKPLCSECPIRRDCPYPDTIDALPVAKAAKTAKTPKASSRANAQASTKTKKTSTAKASPTARTSKPGKRSSAAKTSKKATKAGKRTKKASA